MSDGIFQGAYKRVRSRHTEDGWLTLTPRQITEEIYSEIKEIDLQRANAAQESGKRHSKEPAK